MVESRDYVELDRSTVEDQAGRNEVWDKREVNNRQEQEIEKTLGM